MMRIGERRDALKRAGYPDTCEDMDITDGLVWMADEIERLRGLIADYRKAVRPGFPIDELHARADALLAELEDKHE